MLVRLSFGRDGLSVTLPGGFEYNVLECPALPALPDPVAAIEAALDRPTAGPPLMENPRYSFKSQ